MDRRLYPMIYKRKSFHIFRDPKTKQEYREICSITEEELTEIREEWEHCTPLVPGIRTAMRIAANEETTCTRSQEYVLLFYSEERPNALANIGYMAEQMDLFLASRNIGALWFALNKAKMPDHDGLKYVIMIAIGKAPRNRFRRDMFKAARKPVSEIWQGEAIDGVTDIVRFAPSACNSQPWIVKNDGHVLDVYRYRSPKKKGVMPEEGLVQWNHVDIGIFLCFLELCLAHEEFRFERELYEDVTDAEENRIARYRYEKREPMDLAALDGRTVRIVMDDGNVFEGECEYNSPAFTEQLCGYEEESLSIDHWIFQKPDIVSAEEINKKTGLLWMGRPVHRMKLRPEPFDAIFYGRKCWELRLYDEKRSALKPGDMIRFEQTDDDLEIQYVRILEIRTYPSFADLYRDIPLTECGYTEETAKTASPKDMEAYYTPEQQEQYGVCAIRIETLC